MARIRKAFKELLSIQKKPEPPKEDSFSKLIRKIQQSPLDKLGTQIVLKQEEELKMSEVLREFVAPFFRDVDIKYHSNFVRLAVTAWNISFLPEDEQQELINNFLEELSGDKEVVEDAHSLMNALIARKNQYFSHIWRYISNYELKRRGDQYDLTVLSTDIKLKSEQ